MCPLPSARRPALLAACLAVLSSACGSDSAPPGGSTPDAGKPWNSPSAQTVDAGFDAPTDAGTASDAGGHARPCAPAGGGSVEFFMECDAGESADLNAAPDAADLPVAPDAGRLDAGQPPEPDEGECADQENDCSLGHAETTVGSASCHISGDTLQVDREICEVCGLRADILDYSVTIMDCDVCEHVYSMGWGTFFESIAPGSCKTRADWLTLNQTNADRTCIDVYAYVGSADSTASSSVLHSHDRVRMCRCDRSTDTCVSCAGGSCGG